MGVYAVSGNITRAGSARAMPETIISVDEQRGWGLLLVPLAFLTESASSHE